MSPLKIFFLSFTITIYAVYYLSVKTNSNVEKNIISIESLKNDTSKDTTIFKELNSEKNEKSLRKQINQKEKPFKLFEKVEMKEKKVLPPVKNDSKVNLKKLDKDLIDIQIIKNKNKKYYSMFPSITLKSSIKKGELIFRKKLRKYCRFSGVRFAKKHTQDEWEEIWDEGNFKNETKKICPRVKLRKIKQSWWKYIYAFVYAYASDSSNITKVKPSTS